MAAELDHHKGQREYYAGQGYHARSDGGKIAVAAETLRDEDSPG